MLQREGSVLFHFIVIAILASVIGLEWTPPSPPECGSYNSLCGITFDVNGTGADAVGSKSVQSGSPMCQCPDNKTCHSPVEETDRVLHLVLPSRDQTIQTKLTYCNLLKRNPRHCRMGELAAVLRGVGPVLLNIVGSIKCTCDEPLTLKKSRPQGMYSIQGYACGKKTCQVNESQQPICERIWRRSGIFSGGDVEVTRYQCECPSGYACAVNNTFKPNSATEVVEFTCKPKSLQ